MVDQCHNLKPKIEAMIQTVTTAQELFAKACMVDRKKLRDAQARMNVVDAENCLKDAFATDVRPMLEEWRTKKGIDPRPLEAYRASGYEARRKRARGAPRRRRKPLGSDIRVSIVTSPERLTVLTGHL